MSKTLLLFRRRFEATPFSVSNSIPLHSPRLSVLSLTPTQILSHQRRKFFLDLDDKDILEIYGNDFLWNWIQTQLLLLL